MLWNKLGHLFSIDNINPYLISHTANPLAIHLHGDVFRILYSGRDKKNRSSVGYVDIDIIKRKVVYIHKEPVFTFGCEDSFYSHGVSIGNYYEVDGQKYILFMGWQIPDGQHWRGDIGRLKLSDDFILTLDSSEPFMGISPIDHVSLSYPWVQYGMDGIWHMWYGSTITWDAGNGEMLHVINYATSENGHNWVRHGQAIPSRLGLAQAFSRPTVLGNEKDGFHMWFSYRSGTGEKYRIGYAVSHDAISWVLKVEDSGIDVSDNGWDSEMIEYPYVFEHKDNTYMLYNGNGNGKTGFGLAVLEC